MNTELVAIIIGALALMGVIAIVADRFPSVRAFAAAIGVGAIALAAFINAHTAKVNERHDFERAKAAEYRLCERLGRVKAHLHSKAPIGSAERKHLEDFNPIVNCLPNLQGKPAVPISVEAQRRKVRAYQRGDLDPLPEAPRSG